LADPDVDAVYNPLPNHLHVPITLAAARAGKHVLCEKPLAGSLEDARAMAALERSAEVVTAVGYTFRRAPGIAAIRDHVLRGELGDLSLFSGRYWCDYATDPNGPLSWRFKGGAGSGALGDIGSHIIDAAEYIAGPIASVSGAVLSTQITKRALPLGAVVGHNAAPVSDEFGEVENEDTASFTARFQSGLAATFSVSRTAFGMPNGLGFDVYGTAGRCSFDFHRPAEYEIDDAQPEARTRDLRRVIVGPQMPYFKNGYPMEAPGVGIGNQEAFTYQARAFLDQIAGSTTLPPCPDMAHGLHNPRVLEAIVSATDKPVQL